MFAASGYGFLAASYRDYGGSTGSPSEAGLNIPVLFVHGDEDRVTPINLAKRLFERANEPKAFISVAGGGHLVLGLPEVFVRVREWIDTWAVVKRHSGAARE
jgi:fermentation-respiration switch protein FrsA (DUF1100 family)